jgi:hypothetical protein
VPLLLVFDLADLNSRHEAQPIAPVGLQTLQPPSKLASFSYSHEGHALKQLSRVQRLPVALNKMERGMMQKGSWGSGSCLERLPYAGKRYLLGDIRKEDFFLHLRFVIFDRF